MHLDPTAVLSQFLGTLPVFVAVVLASMQNNKRIDDLRDQLKDLIKTDAALLRAEMRRVAEVMDARLKHFEQE